MAFKLNDEFLMYVGTALLALFIVFDLYKAYGRGAKWLPGNFLLFCGLCVQLLGYLDIQHLSLASRHKEDDLRTLIAKQLSIDSSRLVLFVFVGYLLPGLASAARLWSNIAALLISLTSHIAIELLVVQTYASEKDTVVEGQSGIWLIADYYVLISSILGLFFLFIWAFGTGRFIRDNLSSRIQSILSESDNNEASSWDNYERSILKCWIVARVCQPEYMLGRTCFSAGVGIVLTNCVGVFSAKVICLRSQLHWPLPLLTLQFVFIIVVWLAVMYRWYSAVIYFRGFEILFNFRFYFLVILICHILWRLLKSYLLPSCLLLLLIPLALPIGVLYLILCVIFCCFYLAFVLYIVICAFSWWLSGLILGNKIVEGLCRVQTKPRCEQDFINYKPTLKRLCLRKEDPGSLWVANEKSFKEIKDQINKGCDRGKNCQELIAVIGSKLGGNYVKVRQLLEPVGSVREYFPMLKDSFRRITAQSLLFIMSELMTDQKDKKYIENAKTAYKQAKEMMDFVDCPDDVGIDVDVLGTKNVEAFVVRSEFGEHKQMKFVDFRRKNNVQGTITVDNALGFICELREKARQKLNWRDLFGKREPDEDILEADWNEVAEYYGVYKVCKIILDSRPDTLQDLLDELSHLFAELIALCVEESQEILQSNTKRWAKKFKEDKISAAIEIAGFAWGVKVAVQPQASTIVADTAVVIDNL